MSTDTINIIFVFVIIDVIITFNLIFYCIKRNIKCNTITIFTVICPIINLIYLFYLICKRKININPFRNFKINFKELFK